MSPLTKKSVREYTPASHRFFDEVALFLATIASSYVVAEAFRTGGRTKVTSDPLYYIQFLPCTLSVELTWYPQETLMALFSNSWPRSIALHEKLAHPRVPSFILSSDEAKNLHAVALQSCLLRYFESNRPQIEAKFGTDPGAWPASWNFARVIRNAFAHGGVITFKNLASPAVTWKSLSYGPTQQGRQIIFQDINFVEVISLLEELDVHL